MWEISEDFGQKQVASSGKIKGGWGSTSWVETAGGSQSGQKQDPWCKRQRQGQPGLPVVWTEGTEKRAGL